MTSFKQFAIGHPRLTKAIAVISALAVLALVVSWTPQARAVVRALVFVPQVLPAVPVKPAEWFTQAPERIEIAYPLSDGSIGTADLYLPASGDGHSAVLFFLGVNPAGKNDERVVNVGSAMARTGTAVMIPWSERMTQRRVDSREVDDLVLAFQHLQARGEVDPDKVGMAGFCVGASLLMVAAQDERIRDQVRVVNSFGGYYDAKDLIASVAAESRFYEGDKMPWAPDPLSVEVVRTHLLESVRDLDERSRLLQALENESVPAGSLSPEGQTVYEILTSTDLEAAHRHILRLPPSSTETLDRISPSTNIGDLHSKVLVMHDREDKLVPSEESRRLVDALRPRGDVFYTEFSFFDHLDPTRRVGRLEFLREGAKLSSHMYRIMRELN